MIPSVRKRDEERTLATKENVVSAVRFELMERDNKKLRTEVSNMRIQLNSVVEMMTSFFSKMDATKRPPRIDSPPIKRERRVYDISSDSSSATE